MINIFIEPARDDVRPVIVRNTIVAWHSKQSTKFWIAHVDAGVRRGLELGAEVQYFLAEDESGVIGQIMLREWSDWRTLDDLAAKRLRGQKNAERESFDYCLNALSNWPACVAMRFVFGCMSSIRKRSCDGNLSPTGISETADIWSWKCRWTRKQIQFI